ncbi:MAG: hypothetical protein KDE27_30635 [Planctomycetes bacterium]|nr:hypothetical protein [Planctomycetota bacterium]
MKLPGREFQSEALGLRDALTESLNRNSAFPFHRLFDFMSLSASNRELEMQMRARGDIRFADGAFENVSDDPIDTVVRDVDSQGNNIELYVDTELRGRANRTGAVLGLVFESANALAIVDFLPPALGFGNRFLAAELTFSDSKVDFLLREEDEPTHQLVISLDLRLSRNDVETEVWTAAAAKGLTPSFSMVATEALVDGPCCGGRPRPRPRRQCVNLHVKVLIEPSLPIAEMVEATRQLFADRGLPVSLLTTEQLNLPQFLDLPVGTCILGQTTPEQRQLFGHRTSVGSTDIAVYFVRSTIPAFAGCAAHPPGQPSLVVARNADIWTLPHEIGHVLGLTHVNDNRRLMTGNGTYNVVDPPPDLVQAEINTMLDSPYSIPC